MPGHTFHPSILREYDVRGIVDETLFEADAEWVGRTYRDRAGAAIEPRADDRGRA